MYTHAHIPMYYVYYCVYLWHAREGCYPLNGHHLPLQVAGHADRPVQGLQVEGYNISDIVENQYTHVNKV